MKLKLTPPSCLVIQAYKTASHTFIIFKFFKTFFFFKLRQNVIFIKLQKKIFFVAKKILLSTLLSLRALYFKIASLLKKQKHFFCKKVFLQGLGFKINLVTQNGFIELKIGYSHSVKIFIPIKDNLSLHTNKNMIVVKGSKKDKVGNFANKIKSFRIPDNYKGKGIWYKKEIKVLKDIKKT